MIDYLEERTLKAICAHHGVTDPQLISDLSALMEWAH